MNTKVSTSAEKEYQADFFDKASGLDLAIKAFKDLHTAYFFVKNLESRFVFVNMPIALRLGECDPDLVILKQDEDYRPPALVDRYVKDDQKVITSGKAIRNYREPLFHPYQGFLWAVTSKWPIHSADGQVIGVAGVTQEERYQVDDVEIPEPCLIPPHDIDSLIVYISGNKDRSITSEEMAKSAAMSVRQLNRRTQETHGLSPRNFATFIRIQLASQKLVESDLPLIDIALSHGFSDQASFSNQFKKFIGMTPSQFRQKWRKSPRSVS